MRINLKIPNFVVEAIFLTVALQQDRTKNEARVRGLLRRFPWWVNGHVRLANLQVEKGDFEGAYISSQAIGVLTTSLKYRRISRHLQAKSYTAFGQFDNALEILCELCAHRTDESTMTELLEDKAACFLGLGRLDEAKQTLKLINSDHRSVSANAVLDYIESQSEQRVGTHDYSKLHR